MNRSIRTESLIATLTALLAVLSAVPRTSRACIGDQYDSIHFNSGNPDFGTPPRRATISWRSEYFNRPVKPTYSGDAYESKFAIELSSEKDDAAEQRRTKQWGTFRRAAQSAITANHWQQARQTYEQCGKTLGWTGTLRDRVEVLTRAAKPGTQISPTEIAVLRRYLSALNQMDNKQDTKAAHDSLVLFDAIAQDSAAPAYLRGHAMYQLERYTDLLHTYPTIKREAALIMIARKALLSKVPADQHPDVAAGAIHQLLAEFPHTRFRHAALGLRARIDYLQGHYDSAARMYFALGDLVSVRWIRKKLGPGEVRDRMDARLLAAYLKQLDTAKRYETYARTITDIDFILGRISPAGARFFVQRLLSEPDLAAPYFYFRLYHCENHPRDLVQLAKLADRIAAQSEVRAAQLPLALQVRLAEVYYQRGEYRRALPWVNRAMSGDSHAPGYDRALYVRGAIRLKQHRYQSARADFDTLLANYPNSPLRAATHEEIALEAESTGDLGTALQQYLYLDYKPDIAYFLDVRMTPAEIARFLRDHPQHPQRHLIQYSLGIRYLRSERFKQAERCFTRLPHSIYVALNKGRHFEGKDLYSVDSGSADPLTVIHQLAALKANVDSARRDTTRAKALFQYASYYYTHGTLLLYNGAVWQDNRSMNFCFYWNKDHATAEDNDTTYQHMYEHEIYARTKRICLQIARDYPDTPSAPPALYRAACCARKLGGFNDWWREDKPDHFMEASRLMKRFVRTYPKHFLTPHARKYAMVFYREGGGK